MNVRNLMLTSLFAFGLAACGPQKPVGNDVEDEKAPEFQGGGQQVKVGEDVYPGPYGLGIGSVVRNYQFYAYPRGELSPPELELIELADFYNPTGAEVYPEGSPYGAGTLKPKALVLDRSAIWCGPCQIEAKTEIPKYRAQFAPAGEFLVVLDDGPTPGTAATAAEVRGWAEYYDNNYPTAIDPNQTLSAIVGKDAYPGNVIIRTKDMKIITWVAGVPGASFWNVFEQVINDQPISGVD